MTDDEIDRLLRNARPEQDDAWARSDDGERALDAIRAAAEDGYRSRGARIRLPRRAERGAAWRRPVLVGLCTAVVAAALAGVAVSTSSDDRARPRIGPAVAVPKPPAGHNGDVRVRPQDLALASYGTCDAALAGLRAHTAAHVTRDGLPLYDPRSEFDVLHGGIVDGSDGSAPIPVPAPAAKSAAGADAATHSGTNDQEVGADEPDLLKTDGRRIVTVSDSQLRVTDVSTRRITGTLDLSAYAGAETAQLLMSGDRALVLLGQAGTARYGGPEALPVRRSYAIAPPDATTVLLVDLAAQTPTIVSMFRPTGELVDARLVGGTARIVIRSTPRITLTRPPARTKSPEQWYRQQVRRAPLSDWLPSWTVTTGGDTATTALPCEQLSHPVSYSGLSSLTVYSVDPQAGFDNVAPVSIAADADTVYATTSSLYVATSVKGGTDLHRFDIHAPGRPAYLGSGVVGGQVSDSYSMSDWRGTLRVITTKGDNHTLYVLDADTLTQLAYVSGIGKGEQLYAVRFLGDLGYVVTYEQVDPLFVLDLRNPRHPAVAGRLTLTGFSSYLHQVGNGRLLGVGEATVPAKDEPGYARPVGLQVSLFDVSTPAQPQALSRIVRRGTAGDGQLDPHAFLYWASRDLAVVPIQGWDSTGSGGVLVVHVARDQLTSVGTVTNPAATADDAGIERSFVAGGSLWTFSAGGLQASNLTTLARQAWLPFG